MDIRLTDDRSEAIAIGKGIVEQKANVYDERMLVMLYERIRKMMPEAGEEELDEALYMSVYDYWLFGTNIAEEFYYDFFNKTIEEKREYITFRSRFLYFEHLNDRVYSHRVFDDKYESYKLLKPYYLRDVIRISDKDDFASFCEFVEKHPEFVVKPQDLGLAIGVHKVDARHYPDRQTLFDELIDEGRRNHETYKWGEASGVVLEEIIDQDPEMARIHPPSANGVRLTTLNMDGKISAWYPWLKIGTKGQFVTGGAISAGLAGINPESGIVETAARDEWCREYSVHPDTGVVLKGFQIPKWGELLELTGELAKMFPEIRYIGWDMVLTPKGWCVMEVNPDGEFIGQLLYQRGMKKEFEELIHWAPEKQYWWE